MGVNRLPPSQVIAEHRAAYERANGIHCPSLNYKNGWFLMGSHIGLRVTRYRSAQLIHMTAQLKERAKATGGSNEGRD